MKHSIPDLDSEERWVERVWAINVCPECGEHKPLSTVCSAHPKRLSGGRIENTRVVQVEVVRASLAASLAEALGPLAALADQADGFGHEDDSTALWRLRASELRAARSVLAVYHEALGVGGVRHAG